MTWKKFFLSLSYYTLQETNARLFNLFKSFFFINSIFVKNVTNAYLSPTKFLSRVLQGSILDPLIFQIYVNNMPQEIYLPFYLDGSCLIFQHLNI